MKKVLLITDNEVLLNRFKSLTIECELDSGSVFYYAFSKRNKTFTEKFKDENWIQPLDVKAEVSTLIETYDIIFSLHCKQIFPVELVRNVRCINIHPGLNPHNRGWYPQVFSIINGLPSGATIHEIDEHLDHGPVICQKEVTVETWDTSITLYNKILDAEIELLRESFKSILEGSYKTIQTEEGNLNLKKDFNELCKIDLNESGTFLNHINKLRALTHGDFNNAYFTDKTGAKVYLRLELFREEK